MEKETLSKVELLAPAGSYEAFIAAINAGAHAIYMGLKNFNARVMTNNFDLNEYISSIDYAHKRDVKVYLTLNTLLVDSEVKEALELVYELYKVGLDGVIVQDLGIADLIHKIMPDLSLHASTQMSVCTLEQVKMLERLGFDRVVLARELSIEEIKKICQNTKLEIEVFVHGALCVAVSGQCLMSAMIGARSANRGSCAGTCRKKYSLYNSNGKIIEKNKYLLSKKDIFGLDKLDELITIGVHSLKIEGRNKTPEYVAGVVRSYRQALDFGYDDTQDKEVLQLFNRSGKSYGYLNGVRFKDSISKDTPKNTGVMLGKVLDVKKEYIKVKLCESIALHDGIEIADKNDASTIVTCIRDDRFNVVNKEVEKNNIVWLGDIKSASVGDVVFKTSNYKLNQELKKYSSLNLRKVKYDVSVEIIKDKPIKAYYQDVCVETQYIPETANSICVNEEKIKQAFLKTEDTSVIFNVTAYVDDGLFVPVSKLNELRQMLVKAIENKKIIRKEIKNIDKKIEQALEIKIDKKEYQHTSSLYVYRYNEEMDYIKFYENKYQEKLDVIYINAADFKRYETSILKYINNCKVYFVIPNVVLKNEKKYIEENLERLINKGVSGVLIGNVGDIDSCLKLKEKYNIKLVADYSLNITNCYSANKLIELGFDTLTPLVERDLNIEKVFQKFDTEAVEGLVTVMTTRYCVISSFVKNAKEKLECQSECLKNKYYLLDEQNKRYDIVTNNFDCITKIVRNIKKSQDVEYNRIRHCIL